ncbi:beta-class carbonic anhydrase [Nocardioides dongxiaopingii]|uniref:beta-class carbonic anhydrase n=1 Tax=Nocardioides dongxiaopingii TaxID=2576036 RepID=UPI0010C770C6|nr:carbonic anhydrase [Nocardioides dongxiaopingii]
MHDFDDLLAANRVFAAEFDFGGFDGIAHAGVGIVTCMDSRIEPLGMLGLKPGDAKILRNPGGRVDHSTLEALVLGVHLLRVDRILVVPHTRCAVATSTQEEVRERVAASAGDIGAWEPMHVVRDQLDSLADDVQKVRTHHLVPDHVQVGGFLYDVDSGLLVQHY